LASQRELNSIMLISNHAIFSTLPAPFIPAGWQQVPSTTFGTSSINAIAYDGFERYVAVGNQGKIATSDDNGVTWTAREGNFLESNIYAIAYGNGLWIAGGSAGKIATSPDGVTWTQRASSFGASVILSLTYAPSGSTWVAVGGSGKLATSIDGLGWVQRSSSFGTTFINTVFSTENIIIAAGFEGKLATSISGTSWIQRSSSFVTSTIHDITVNPQKTRFVAVGDAGKVANSTNGTTWTQAFPGTSFAASSIRAVAATTDSYVAAGAAGKLATSIDTTFWFQRDSSFGLDVINGLYARDGVAIAVGDRGKIGYSI
jgi:photosystem II stability/assembly factor-like uncharacterized protein